MAKSRNPESQASLSGTQGSKETGTTGGTVPSAPDTQTVGALPDLTNLEATPPRGKTALEEAYEELWRAELMARQLLAALGRLLLSPLVGPLRQSAAKHQVPFAGDARAWKPLTSVLKVIGELKPLEGPTSPPSHNDSQVK